MRKLDNNWLGNKIQEASMANKIKTGKDSVVIGNVTGEVGEGSVVIGTTDANGNTIINQPRL